MAKSRSQLGFTLIEVLLAMALLMLLILTAGLVYDYVNQNWQRQQTAYQNAVNAHMDWRRMSRVVRNTYPRMVYADDPFQYFGAQSVPPYGFYFLGRDNGFTGVSYMSVQDPEQPSVFRLFREPDPDEPELWQLVYEEAPLANVGLSYASVELPFNLRRVLRQGLEQIEFDYFAYPSFSHRQRSQLISLDSAAQREGMPRWFEQFDGLETGEHPFRLRLRMDDETIVWPLQDSVSAQRARWEFR